VETQALEEEQDIIALLATQGEDDSDFDEDEFDTSLPDDTEALKQMLEREREIKQKRNKTLKKREQAIHRMQEEQDAMKKRLDELMTKSEQSPNVEAEKREREEAHQKWRDSVADDPSKAVDFATWQMGEMQENMVNYLAKMQTSFDSQIAELKGEMSPDKQKYRDKINSLKRNPEFSDMDDNTILKFIRATESLKQPRGSIGGRRAEANPSEEQALEEARKKYRQMFGNEL
jgi:hypothetical protein